MQQAHHVVGVPLTALVFFGVDACDVVGGDALKLAVVEPPIAAVPKSG